MSAVTKGLPSRSPPIQLPMRKKFREAGFQLVLELAVEPGQFRKEGVVVVADAVLHLVHHRQPVGPQHAGAPQGEHGGAQGSVVVGGLFRGHGHPVPGIQQAGHLPLAVQDALAADLGGVGRQHRRNQGMTEGLGQGLAADAGFGQTLQGAGQAAFPRLGAGDFMGAAAADVVLIFGDVGEVQEIGEGPHHGEHGVPGQVVEDGGQLVPGRRLLVPGEAHGDLADGLDGGEGLAALLFAHGVAEEATEEADVLPQGLVLVGGGREVGRRGGSVQGHGFSLKANHDPARLLRCNRGAYGGFHRCRAGDRAFVPHQSGTLPPC